MSENRMSEPAQTDRSRTGRKLLWRGGWLGAIVLVLAWIFSHFWGAGPGGGGGAATGPSQPGPTPAPTTIPSEPMQVVIREDRYIVDGKDWPMDQVVLAAEHRGSQSAPVKVITEPDSRLGAERDLEAAMDAAHVAYSVETQGGTQSP